MADKGKNIDDNSFSCCVCGSVNNLKRCARCKNALYCCREHQISDWATHKSECLNTTNCQKQIAEMKVENDGNKHEDKSVSQVNGNDGFDFDSRTFVSIEFDKPKSYNFRNLAKFIVKKLYFNGYCVVDDMFDISHLREVLKEVKDLEKMDAMQSGKLAGGRTSGEDSEKVVNANIRLDKLVWLEGTEKAYPNLCKVIKTMDTIIAHVNPILKDGHNINRRTKAMVATYPGNGTYYRRHVDNPNKDGRLITCISYLNENWDVQKDGGLLRIFPEESDSCVDIPPLLNRLLFFWSDRRNPHEVQPAFRNRYACTVWYFDEKEREEADREQLYKAQHQMWGSLALSEVETKRKEKENLEKRIETETHKAFMSLSEEELNAMSELLAGQPDPRAVLESLGISSVILDKLIEVIKKRQDVI